VQNKYLVLYRAPVSAMQQIDGSTPEQRKAGMEAWMTWAHKVGDAMVDMGSPLGPAATVGGKGPQGYVGGFSVLRADNLDKAKRLLDGHPHLQVPGATIDVMEYLPTPGM
jgi:hypothetical protein